VGRVVLVVLVVHLVRVPVLGAGTVTTAMLHRRCPGHRDAPSSWLRRGRCRGCPGARGAGASAEARGPGRPRLSLVPAARLRRKAPARLRRKEPRPMRDGCGSWGVRGPGGWYTPRQGGSVVTSVAASASRALCRHRVHRRLTCVAAALRARWHTGYPRTWAVAHRPRPAAPSRARGPAPPPARGWQSRGRGWHQAHRRHREHHPPPAAAELTLREPHPCGNVPVACGTPSRRAGPGAAWTRADRDR
jgi:hypothetical protein